MTDEYHWIDVRPVTRASRADLGWTVAECELCGATSENAEPYTEDWIHEHAERCHPLTVQYERWLPGDPPARRRGLEALGELIAALADTTTHHLRWAYRCDLGIAGHVLFSIDVYPHGLTQAERDTILTTAARLANWSHT